MEFFGGFVDAIVNYYIAFSESWVYLVIRVFLFLYIFVLIADVLLLIYVGGGIKKWMRSAKYGMSNVAERPKYRKQWKAVFDRLKSDHERHWKIAILEADHLISQAMRDTGYEGDNFQQQVDQIPEGVHSSLEALKEAHAVRNAIIHDDSYEVDKDDAKRFLDAYYNFLGALGAVPQKR